MFSNLNNKVYKVVNKHVDAFNAVLFKVLLSTTWSGFGKSTELKSAVNKDINTVFICMLDLVSSFVSRSVR